MSDFEKRIADLLEEQNEILRDVKHEVNQNTAMVANLAVMMVDDNESERINKEEYDYEIWRESLPICREITTDWSTGTLRRGMKTYDNQIASWDKWDDRHVVLDVPGVDPEDDVVEIRVTHVGYDNNMQEYFCLAHPKDGTYVLPGDDACDEFRVDNDSEAMKHARGEV